MMAEYMAEKQGCETFEREHGFIVYVFREDNSVHINNIFVRAEKRREGYASKLMDEFINGVCKKNEVTLITSVCDHAQYGPELSIMSTLGFRGSKGERFRVLPEEKMTKFFMELNHG